jgi:hypothetical protein
MADFKSANYDIPALSKEVMVSYWDTAGVRVGTYDTKVFLKYGAKSIPSDLQLKVEQNRIEVIGLGYVISEEAGGDNTLMFVIVVGIIVLILVNVLWFFLLRKRLKGGGR